MGQIRTLPLVRALAMGLAALALAPAADAAGDKGAYEQARQKAASNYEAAKKRCDGMSGSAKSVCVAEAKAARTRTEEQAEVLYQGTPKAREHAKNEIAAAEYRVARERCEERSGNDKDVCIKVAKAVRTRAEADAKAERKISDAREDAARHKREADYKVAAEKCEALTGDAKAACIAQAKTRYGM
jgi:hypothetical protein